MSTRSEKFFHAAPPEAFFVLSAMAQYGGAVIAVHLFDEISPATVAWIRVLSAGVLLYVFSLRQQHAPWTRRDLTWACIFGLFTACMNLTFYLAIDRLPLGKGVTIEFIGPITVAALRTKSMRNTGALLLATIGVVVLGGVEIGNEPLGLFLILLASVMWSGYIVVGSKVALGDRGVAGLGIGLIVGGLVVTPFGVGDAHVAFSSVRILLLCVAVGALSNAIGYGIDQSTMRRIPIRRFSVMLALLPVCAATAGFLFLNQTPSAIDLMGMCLVLAGVAIQERETLERHHQDMETT